METGLETGHSYRLFGNRNKPAIVILTAMASVSAEWWHLAEAWSAESCVLTYDRLGYGKSTPTRMPRTPAMLAYELNTLLLRLEINRPILIGHSLGGLYAHEYARTFSKNTRGLVLIDAVSPEDWRLKTTLSRNQYNKSGIDKRSHLWLARIITNLGLGNLFLPLLRKAPPFYYYANFSEEATDYILQSATHPTMYRSAISEYKHLSSEPSKAGQTIARLSSVPMALVLHDSETMISEIIRFGGADRDAAVAVDAAWVTLMREYLQWYDHSRILIAERSSHSIHLTEPEKILNALKVIQRRFK